MIYYFFYGTKCPYLHGHLGIMLAGRHSQMSTNIRSCIFLEPCLDDCNHCHFNGSCSVMLSLHVDVMGLYHNHAGWLHSQRQAVFLECDTHESDDILLVILATMSLLMLLIDSVFTTAATTTFEVTTKLRIMIVATKKFWIKKIFHCLRRINYIYSMRWPVCWPRALHSWIVPKRRMLKSVWGIWRYAFTIRSDYTLLWTGTVCLRLHATPGSFSWRVVRCHWSGIRRFLPGTRNHFCILFLPCVLVQRKALVSCRILDIWMRPWRVLAYVGLW
jgi:hypothetical protein